MKAHKARFRLLCAIAVTLMFAGAGSLQTAQAFRFVGPGPTISCTGFSSFTVNTFDDGDDIVLNAVDSQGTTLYTFALQFPASGDFVIGPGTWTSTPADGTISLTVGGQSLEVPVTFTGNVSGCGAQPGPPIPPGYHQTVINCTSALYDAPGGNQIPGTVVYDGQTFYTDEQTQTDSAGREWIAVFVGGDNVAYILAHCAGKFDPHMPPPHFVTLKSTCNVPVYDKPGGKPLGNYEVKAGQIIAAGLIHYQDPNGKLWNQVMVDQGVVGYVWTVCIDP